MTTQSKTDFFVYHTFHTIRFYKTEDDYIYICIKRMNSLKQKMKKVFGKQNSEEKKTSLKT